MKFSAAVLVLAAVLSTAPAFAAKWSEATQIDIKWGEAAQISINRAPGTGAEKFSAVEIPAPAAPSKAAPRDGQNYSGAEELLIKEFGITGITIDIPETEVMRQDRFYNNVFCFEYALRLALGDLLENHNNATSPLAKALAEMGAAQNPSKSELKKARQKVMELLNNPASQISIVRPYAQNQPWNGETVEKNWIFFLRLDGNPYWVIVDRADETRVYAYGAN